MVGKPVKFWLVRVKLWVMVCVCSKGVKQNCRILSRKRYACSPMTSFCVRVNHRYLCMGKLGLPDALDQPNFLLGEGNLTIVVLVVDSAPPL